MTCSSKLKETVRQNKRTLEGNSASEKNNFSIMAEEEIKVLVIGVYKGCLAKQYAQKHFNEELKIGIQHTPTRSPYDGRQNFVSRHICRHPTCVDTRVKFGESHVTSWYCRCRIGSRVVGLCACIVSVCILALCVLAAYLVKPFVHDWNQYFFLLITR